MKKNLLKPIASLAIAALATASLTAQAADFEPVVYGQDYSISESNPIRVIIEPEQAGTLSITQKVSWDSHLFTIQDPTSIESSIIASGYTNDPYDNTYTLFYELMPGTYYYIAPFPYETLVMVSFNFEPADGIDNKITEGDSFTAGGGKNTWYFESPVDGTLIVSTNYNGDLTLKEPFLYKDLFFSEIMPCSNVELKTGGSDYYFTVKAGSTYYLRYENASQPITFTFNTTQEAPIDKVSVVSVDPAPGLAFDPINYTDGAMVVFKPQDVTWSDITFSYTTKNGEDVSVPVTDNFEAGGALHIGIAKLYNDALPLVEEGSVCTICMNGVNYNGSPLNNTVVDGATVEDGNLIFSYEFATAPKLINANLPAEFYSYWPEGSNNGKVVLTFDKEIKNASEASIIFEHYVPGRELEGEFNVYNVTPEIQGNTVTYDLSGVERTGKKSEISFFIPSVQGINGLYAEMGDFGTQYVAYIPFNGGEYDGPDEPEPELPEAKLISPAAGVSTMYNMTVVWDYETLTAGTLKSTLTIPDGTKVEYTGRIVDESNSNEGDIMTLATEDNGYQITFPAGYSDPGFYTLTIPEGSVYINGIPNSPVSLIYELGEEFTMGYAENVGSVGVYTQFLQTVQLSWGYENLLETPDMYVELSYEDGTPEKITNLMLVTYDPNENGGGGIAPTASTGNVLYIDLSDKINMFEKGKYELIIPRGIVKNELGEVNPYQTFEFYVLNAVSEYTVTPESGATLEAPNATLELSWEGFPNISYNQYASNIMIDKRGAERDYLYYGDEISIEEDVLKIDLNSLSDGIYEITIPESYIIFGDNDAFSSEIYLSYVITGTPEEGGVISLEADGNGMYNVYDYKGIKVLTTGESSELSTLPQGLYIINGKKVYIRR